MYLKMFHGANLLPENLEKGEYKVGGTAEFDELEPVWVVGFMGDKVGNFAVGNGGYIANRNGSSDYVFNMYYFGGIQSSFAKY